jgi:hypothetical protein
MPDTVRHPVRATAASVALARTTFRPNMLPVGITTKCYERVIMTMTGHRTRAVFDRYNVVEDGDGERARALIERGIETETAAVAVGRGLDTVRDQDSSTDEKKAS